MAEAGIDWAGLFCAGCPLFCASSVFFVVVINWISWLQENSSKKRPGFPNFLKFGKQMAKPWPNFFGPNFKLEVENPSSRNWKLEVERQLPEVRSWRLRETGFWRSRLACIIARILEARGGGFVSKLACIIAGLYHSSNNIGPRRRFRIIASVYRSSLVRVQISLLKFNFQLPEVRSWKLNCNFQLPEVTVGSWKLGLSKPVWTLTPPTPRPNFLKSRH